MQTLQLNGIDIQIIKHKTYEIVDIISDKCDLIITMNITYSLAKKICDKNKTIAYFVSCSHDIAKLVKQRFFIASAHMKIYRTDNYVFFSTSNLSLSSWDEITLKLKRTGELDNFVYTLQQALKLRNEFIRAFH